MQPMMLKKKYHLWRMFSSVFIFPFVYERAATRRWLSTHPIVFQHCAKGKLTAHSSFPVSNLHTSHCPALLSPFRPPSSIWNQKGWNHRTNLSICFCIWVSAWVAHMMAPHGSPWLVEELRTSNGIAACCIKLVFLTGEGLLISQNLDEAACWAKAAQD